MTNFFLFVERKAAKPNVSAVLESIPVSFHSFGLKEPIIFFFGLLASFFAQTTADYIYIFLLALFGRG